MPGFIYLFMAFGRWEKLKLFSLATCILRYNNWYFSVFSLSTNFLKISWFLLTTLIIKTSLCCFFLLTDTTTLKSCLTCLGGSGEDCALRGPQRRPHLHRLSDGHCGESPEGGWEGAAPDVDDLPDVHGADLQDRQDVVGQGKLNEGFKVLMKERVSGWSSNCVKGSQVWEFFCSDFEFCTFYS